jgi:HEAT repeat protein
MTTNYSAPVGKLLMYGDCRNFKKWPNYLELGLTKEHIPELIRMATDEELAWADSDSLEVWAPTHAWRALGQLRAEEAIDPLMSLFHELEEDEWVGEELPEVYGMIGPKAIPVLAAYLADTSHNMFPRLRAAHSLERIGNQHPETRDECVTVLTRQLERFADNDPEFNGLLISYLVDLKAPEVQSKVYHRNRKEEKDQNRQK